MRTSLIRLSLVLSAACGGPATDGPLPAPEETVAADALEARRDALKEQLHALVADLGAAGRYDCCIEHPCNQCAMRVGGCRCGEGLRDGEPVCEECAMMWRQGHGAEAGVDPASVRSFLEAQREMEARARGEGPWCVVPPAGAADSPEVAGSPGALPAAR